MNYFLGFRTTDNVLVADFEDTVNGGNHAVTGVTPITSGVWHHAAVTYNTTTDTWNLYLDGVLDRTLTIGDFTPEASSIQHAGLATALNSTGAHVRPIRRRARRGPHLERSPHRSADCRGQGPTADQRRRPHRALGPRRRHRHDRGQFDRRRRQRDRRQRAAVGCRRAVRRAE